MIGSEVDAAVRSPVPGTGNALEDAVRSTARLVIATNNVPRFQDKSEGVWRRLIILPMDVKIPPEQRRAGLDKPEFWLNAGELPGILNWAIEGLRRLRANGLKFTNPAASQAALEEQRQESNPARRFLKDYFIEDATAEPMTAFDLYKAYSSWCVREGVQRPLGSSAFGREVRRVFPNARPGKVRSGKLRERAWYGIRLQDAVKDNPAGLRAYQEVEGPEDKAVPKTATAQR
jgi:phage/plasmid-associated DNA primase